MPVKRVMYLFSLMLLAFVSLPTFAQSVLFNPEVQYPVHRSVSPPLRAIPPAMLDHLSDREIPLRRPFGTRPAASFNDPVAQTTAGPTVAATSSNNYNGVGNGFTGPQGTYTVGVAPPDTNMAAGLTQIVQWVNTSFAVFDKSTGAVTYGPVPGNTLWAGVGGPCETNNDGDIIVKYDRAADRWVMTQLAISGGPPYYQCIAVSTTGDATGSYVRYVYQMSTTDLNDYPKLSVWPDAYYMSFNFFAFGAFFRGPVACGLDRNAMLKAQGALMICWQLSSSYASLEPVDLDGSTPPAAGAPGLFLALGGSSSLYLWKAHLDFVNTGNSTITGPVSIPVASYSQACGGGTCIPQLNSTQQLDSLGDRMMYRVSYRNFGTYEAVVANHSVTSGNAAGVRWYELRNPFGTPTVFQQGTYAPDTSYRWMGSISMDKAGDIALGYSVSSSTMYPSIAYTGRQPGDALGTMQGETVLYNGTGSQQQGLSRWGDYSALVIDPSDDCTFWYTTEYLAASGTFNWHTRIGSFAFPSCATPATPDFTISASPSSQTVTQGGSTSYTVNVSISGTLGSPVVLSASGLPANATASFSSNNLTASSTVTMTVNTSATTPTGSFTVTITGTSGTLAHSTPVTLVVNSPPTSDFSLSASPSALTVRRGNSVQTTITVAGANGFTGTVGSFSVAGLPANTTASFSPTSVNLSSSTTSAAVTLTISTQSNTPLGTSNLTISATSGAVTHSTSATLQVRKK